jgi:hypothetical protein
MNKNMWMGVLLAAVVALAVTAMWQNRQIAQLKEQLASAAVDKAKAPPVSAAEKPVPEPATPAMPVEPVSAPAPTPVAAPPPAALANTGTTSNYFAGLAGMMKNPQMKEMIRAQQKVMLDRMYGSLPNYLNLPADKLDALKEVLSDRQMALVDAGITAMSGSESDRKQALEESKAIKSDYDQKIQELLGPQDYPAFQQYEQTAAERMSVQMFKQALPADAALTEQQEDNLIAAMYQERKALPTSSLMNNQNTDPSQLTDERVAEMEKQMEQLQQRYADRAAAILTPAQLEQFTTWQKQWSSMQVASLKMAAQMFGNKGASPPPAPSQGSTP